MQTLPLYWLIIYNTDGALLLEKRPAKGIWGGLYCVPCFEKLDDLYAYAERFGIISDGLEEQTTFTHRLTHRLLMITLFRRNKGRLNIFQTAFGYHRNNWRIMVCPNL